jgi:hypothetical protein
MLRQREGLVPKRRLQVISVALRPPQPFVTQPRIRAQRMERKIVRFSRQFDFMNVDGLPAVPGQDFLGFGFFLRRANPHPDQQTLPFRLLFQSQCAFSI